ncbi:MAG TPA: UpxY family transcription antiterminator [Desulfomonilaceae bacterium]|nr:UpxY family transcription antiterminator [Desulfomonilaceae bacterium]
MVENESKQPGEGVRKTAGKTAVQTRYPADRSLDEDLGAWWVMHIKPNCERKVAAYLLSRNISYYLPLHKRRQKIGYYGRIRETEVPLFSGYLCFALDKEKHALLYDTKKFVRIIKVEDQQGFVQELNAISRAIETGEDLLVQPGLVPGKRVLILSGPMEGIEGVVVKRRLERQLALSVKMFNQSVIVRLDPNTKVETL